MSDQDSAEDKAERETPAPGARFLTGDLMGHVARMSAAGSVGLMAIFFVDLADLFFISLLGEQELAAAVGFAGAVVFFTTSIGIGMAIALGALCAREIGAGDPERGRLYATNVIATGAVVSVAVAAALWMMLEPVVALVGAEGRTAELAVRYLAIVAPSLPFMFLLMAAGAILRAHGDARRAMNVTLVAAAANAVLDPLLIFGLNLGLDGAAIASVIARISGAVYGVWLIRRSAGGFAPFAPADWAADVREILALAGPAMLTNVATPVSVAAVTRIVAEFGDDAVAGFAIISRLTPVAFGLVFALSGAVGPIVGQNYGARRFDRVSGTLAASLKFLAGYCLVVSLLLFLARDLIADVFGASDGAREMIYWFSGPLSLLFFFNGALFTANAAFNNMGRPFLSTYLNWARHTIGAIPTALAGAALFGAPGALLGQYLGGVLFGALAVWRAFRLVAERAAPPDQPPQAISWRAVFWPDVQGRG